MGKILCLFILVCNTLFEVQSLQCYVCDDCTKVKLMDIQTCGASTIQGTSTTVTTTKPTVTTPTITTEPISTITFATSSLTPSKLPLISSSAMTERYQTSTTTVGPITNLVPITGFIGPTTPKINPTTNYSETMAELTSKITISPILSFTTNRTIPTTISTSTFSTIDTTESTTLSSTEHLPSTTGPKITYITEPPNSSTTISENTSKSPTFVAPSEFITHTAEPIVNFTATIDQLSSTITSTESNITFIKEPTTVATNEPTTAHPIEHASTAATISKESSPPSTPHITQLIPTTEPIAATNPSGPAIMGSNEDGNATNDVLARKMRSLTKGCTCENIDKCDCLIIDRLKRYALRGLASKEKMKFTCVVDKYQVNGTEIVKRGCAILEEDKKTTCEKSGFGAECKTCETDQCNGASMTQCSAVLLFTLYYVQYF